MATALELVGRIEAVLADMLPGPCVALVYLEELRRQLDASLPGPGEYLVEVGVMGYESPLEAAWGAQSLFTGTYLPNVTVTAPDGQRFDYDLAKEDDQDDSTLQHEDLRNAGDPGQEDDYSMQKEDLRNAGLDLSGATPLTYDDAVRLVASGHYTKTAAVSEEVRERVNQGLLELMGLGIVVAHQLPNGQVVFTRIREVAGE